MSRRALHPSAASAQGTCGSGSQGWHPLGRVAASMAHPGAVASSDGVDGVAAEHSSSPAFFASCFDGGSEAGEC